MRTRRSLWVWGASLLIVPVTAWAMDSDGDGVNDALDVCCDTPPGIAVDATGRPIGDFDLDCDNDLLDFAIYLSGFTGPLVPCGPPDGTPCDDSDPCTFSDVYSNGLCAGTPYTCDDGLPCTADVCDGVGGCTNTIMAGTCLIGGACYGNGTPNPTIACLACNAAASSSAWSPAPDGWACDDGNACTASDTCFGGTCTSVPVVCDDANSCTIDSCVFGTCIQDPGPMNGAGCDDGNPCTVADTCASGVCTGVALDCSHLDTQCSAGACDVFGSCITVPASIGASCDDGDINTVGDQCDSAGNCVGTAVP